MTDDYTLLTPENVELRFEIAGVGSRVAAALIDYLILGVSYAILLIGGSFAVTFLGGVPGISDGARSGGPLTLQATAAYLILAMLVLAIFLGWWGYFILFELLWNGQSPGKRKLGLRVVRAGGQPISLTASLVRNVLRIVDVGLYVGIVIMLIDRRSRRLGDMAAGTLVVREPRFTSVSGSRSAFAPIELPSVEARIVEALPNADRLTMAHYSLIRDFFARRSRLPARQSEVLAAQIASRLGQTLGVTPAEIGDPTAFLATVAHAFEARQTREL
jgi:uncharacterized RDD family membrane protein YckC